MDDWVRDRNKKEKVFRLIGSLGRNYEIEEVKFLEKHSFKNKEDDKEILELIHIGNLCTEIDEIFNLRIKFYRKYPELKFKNHIYVNEIVKNEKRLLNILEYCLSESNETILDDFSIQEIIKYFNKNEINDDIFIFEKLFEKIPKYSYDDIIKNQNWDGSNRNNTNQRLCVELLKKLSEKLILYNPDKFFSNYKEYIGKRYIVFNEIIMYCFQFVKEKYSNEIINYIVNNFNREDIFDIVN